MKAETFFPGIGGGMFLHQRTRGSRGGRVRTIPSLLLGITGQGTSFPFENRGGINTWFIAQAFLSL